MPTGLELTARLSEGRAELARWLDALESFVRDTRVPLGDQEQLELLLDKSNVSNSATALVSDSYRIDSPLIHAQ